MKAGCIAYQLSKWEKITSDPEILSTVSGLVLDFSEETDYKSSVIPSKFSPKEEMFLSVGIKNLLCKGVIKKTQHEEGEYCSPNFLAPKSDGSFRMILNLKKLNDYISYLHLKMEIIKFVLNMVTPNCYMAKNFIKDAYYSIPILPEHQKFLKFSLQEKLYKFSCLPNGLCSGPRKFTKLLKPPLAELKLDYVKIAAYTDDSITLAYSSDISFKNIWKLLLLSFLFFKKK